MKDTAGLGGQGQGGDGVEQSVHKAYAPDDSLVRALNSGHILEDLVFLNLNLHTGGFH